MRKYWRRTSISGTRAVCLSWSGSLLAAPHLLNGDRLLVLEVIALGAEAGLVNEDRGVGAEAGDAQDAVAVDLVSLLGGLARGEELGGYLALGSCLVKDGFGLGG